jgi:hypothetical protein
MSSSIKTCLVQLVHFEAGNKKAMWSSSKVVHSLGLVTRQVLYVKISKKNKNNFVFCFVVITPNQKIVSKLYYKISQMQ